jgi:hypothetical protein
LVANIEPSAVRRCADCFSACGTGYDRERIGRRENPAEAAEFQRDVKLTAVWGNRYIADGIPDVAIVAMTVWVAVPITETPPPLFPTYTREPSGETASAAGWAPTGIVAVTALLAVAMTLTVLSPKFETYT